MFPDIFEVISITYGATDSEFAAPVLSTILISKNLRDVQTPMYSFPIGAENDKTALMFVVSLTRGVFVDLSNSIRIVSPFPIPI